MSKHTIARFHIRGETFEIFVKPDEALDYKLRKVGDLSKILLTDVVYSDANKGMKASTDKLIKNFQTADTLQVAKIILDKGELLLTAEQRKKLVEEKKSRIIDIIHKHCIDASTGLPIPHLRIEQALEQIRIPIDPFRPADQQVNGIIDALKPIIPIKMEIIKMDLIIPPEFAPKAYGAIKNMSTILEEGWMSDGSWHGVVELPAGLRLSFLDTINKIVRGSIQVKILK